MAFAIMGGLLVATMLTLVLLPTLYVAVFGRETTPPQPAATSAAPAG
jgi:Cu/Ag efflux pump CusA